MTEAFWKEKRLEELSHQEWESLCDGCARCCLVKLEDWDSGEYHYTDVACHLLEEGTCRCSDYANRTVKVPTCVQVTPESLPKIAKWMPVTCAYRLLWEGEELRWWHPLVSGDPMSVHEAGISVRGRIFSEKNISEEELEDHIVDWPHWDVLSSESSGD